ncbi:unnamed protein product [Prorocentrum cordatum]|uniref:P-type ATPase C-terminal domain-containing protein n=1 Tax=Prorocentrum cordatum TaxID=2364126 RepID=A0ABN9XEB0_9DINO|nr:unnamed protein product [Polarella glacialis]
MLDIVWMFQYKFKGMVAVPEWLSINFNPVFTSLHMLLVLGLDRDISDEDANSMPHLYKVGPACRLFNTKVFAKWVAIACYHGFICWFIPFNIFIKPDISDLDKKTPSEFWVSSVTSFSCVVFVVCFKLMLVAQNPLGLHTWLPTLITLMMLFLAIFCFSYVLFGPKMQPNMKGIFGDMFGNNDVYLSFAVVIVVALIPDVIMAAVGRVLFPSELDLARREPRKKQAPAEQ